MAYSIELKQKALDYLDKCGSITQVATAFGVDRSTIRAWVKKQQSGNLACSGGGYRYCKTDKQKLLKLIQEKPDAYLYELAQEFGCSSVAVFKALKKMNMSLKKRQPGYIDQDINKVKDFKNKLNQLLDNNYYQLVYLDKTGFDTYLHRTHARSLKGQKVFDKIAGKRYQRISLVAAQIGNRVKNMIAPMIYKNTMTSRLFEKWFKDRLLPTLNQLEQPSIIILDNARFHRMKH